MAFRASQQAELASKGFNPLEALRATLRKGTPWDSIVDFASHPSFCGLPLYPRQGTLLKLVFLETEQMTAYDIDVIEEWRAGFTSRVMPVGVQPDIWERIDYLKARGYRRFPHIQLVLGRRASKGFISGIIGAEQVGYFYSLDNWQAHYGIAEDKIGYCHIGATSLTQAQRQLYADVRSTVESCEYLQRGIAESKDHILSIRTPSDLRRISRMRAAGIPLEHNVASLRVTALSANSSAGRGATCFSIMLDEFAFMLQTGSTKSGDEIYEDWQPSLDQFGHDGLMLVPSSPFNRIGKFYSLYEEGRVLMSSYDGDLRYADGQTALTDGTDDGPELVANPEMLILQAPSWELYRDYSQPRRITGVKPRRRPIQPDMTSEAQQRRKLRNPEKFRVEREGQFADVQGAYLDPQKVEAMFDAVEWREPLEPQSNGRFDRIYRMHCDPGRTGANFSLAIGHIEMAPPDDNGKVFPRVIFDLLHVWKPEDYPPDPETGRRTIDYLDVGRDLESILRRYPSIHKASFDQWNSAKFIADLRAQFSPKIRITEETFTEKANQIRCEKFKSALNLGWISAYRDQFFGDGGSLLEMECKFLSEKNGRVVKQDFGPVTTKDLFDSVCVVATDLLHDALDRWASGALTASAYGSSNGAAVRAGRELDRVDALSRLGTTSPEQYNARKALANSAVQRRRNRTYAPTRASSIKSRDLRR